MWNLLNVTFGTASLAAFVVVIWDLLKHRDGGKRRQGLSVLMLFLALTAGTWWLGRHQSPPSGLQSDTVAVSGRDDDSIEVFYPHAYVRPPNLKLTFKSGSGSLQLLEQRADGFRFKLGDFAYSDEAIVEWKANGAPATSE